VLGPSTCNWSSRKCVSCKKHRTSWMLSSAYCCFRTEIKTLVTFRSKVLLDKLNLDMFIISFSSLSYDRSTASSTESPSASAFNFQYHLVSSGPSSSFLRPRPCLPVPSISFSVFLQLCVLDMYYIWKADEKFGKRIGSVGYLVCHLRIFKIFRPPFILILIKHAVGWILTWKCYHVVHNWINFLCIIEIKLNMSRWSVRLDTYLRGLTESLYEAWRVVINLSSPFWRV
jgi:hypothetical protein